MQHINSVIPPDLPQGGAAEVQLLPVNEQTVQAFSINIETLCVPLGTRWAPPPAVPVQHLAMHAAIRQHCNSKAIMIFAVLLQPS